MSLEVAQFPLELEYKKHSDINPADIARLRAWLRTQLHLPATHITDLDLILAYHSCNHSIEVTKQVLDLNLTFKTHSAVFKDRNLHQTTLDCMTLYVTMPLKQRAYDGCALLYTGFVDSDLKKFNFNESVRITHMVMDLWQFEEGTFPAFHYLIDMQRTTISHISKLELLPIQQMFRYLEEMQLIKMAAIHIVNAPSFVDKLITFIKPFLKKELLDEVHIHPVGSSTLEKYLPVAALPADAGGDDITLKEASAYMIQKLKDNRAFFDDEQKKRVDESLRSAKPKIITDIFGGVEGSFKKLEID